MSSPKASPNSSGSVNHFSGDYDGDGKTHIAVYRVSTGAWWIKPSGSGSIYGVAFGGNNFLDHVYHLSLFKMGVKKNPPLFFSKSKG